MEEWRAVVGYEGWYEVSNRGRVRRVKAAKATTPGKILKEHIGSRGRAKVGLCKNGEERTFDVHRIVAAAFLGPRPDGKQINHIDFDSRNNDASNLEYCTPSENVSHAYRHGFLAARGERQGLSKLTEHDVRLIRNSPLSARMAALHHGVSPLTVKWVRTRKTWKHVA